jgi:hypothetical protein
MKPYQVSGQLFWRLVALNSLIGSSINLRFKELLILYIHLFVQHSFSTKIASADSFLVVEDFGVMTIISELEISVCKPKLLVAFLLT